MKLVPACIAALLVLACAEDNSGYDPAAKSECRPLILPPLMSLTEEAATETDDTILSDDDAESPYFEEKVVVITQETHRLVLLFKTAIACGDDIVYFTKTELDDADPTTLILRLKNKDTDPHVASTCGACETDFTITVDDLQHDLSLLERLHVFYANGLTERTFEF